MWESTSSHVYIAIYGRLSLSRCCVSIISLAHILALISAWLQAVVSNVLDRKCSENIKALITCLWTCITGSLDDLHHDKLVLFFKKKLVTRKLSFCNHEESELAQIPQYFEWHHLQQHYWRDPDYRYETVLVFHFTKGRTLFPKASLYHLFNNIVSFLQYDTTNTSP